MCLCESGGVDQVMEKSEKVAKRLDPGNIRVTQTGLYTFLPRPIW